MLAGMSLSAVAMAAVGVQLHTDQVGVVTMAQVGAVIGLMVVLTMAALTAIRMQVITHLQLFIRRQ